MAPQFFDLTALYIAFWLLSKFFATSCYMTSLIVTSELFPTKWKQIFPWDNLTDFIFTDAVHSPLDSLSLSPISAP